MGRKRKFFYLTDHENDTLRRVLAKLRSTELPDIQAPVALVKPAVEPPQPLSRWAPGPDDPKLEPEIDPKLAEAIAICDQIQRQIDAKNAEIARRASERKPMPEKEIPAVAPQEMPAALCARPWAQLEAGGGTGSNPEEVESLLALLDG